MSTEFVVPWHIVTYDERKEQYKCAGAGIEAVGKHHHAAFSKWLSDLRAARHAMGGLVEGLGSGFAEAKR
jgi:hypothetical protein